MIDGYVWIVAIGGIACFFVGFGIGANDVANNFGTSVGAGSISLLSAMLIAAVFELIGSVGFGASVTSTVKSKIVDPDAYSQMVDVLMYGNLCALLTSGFWLIYASKYGLPVSTTHTIVGSLLGFGLVSNKDAVNWGEVANILISWAIAPLMACVASLLIFLLCRWAVLRRDDPVKVGIRWLWLLVFVVDFVMMVFLIFKNPMILDKVSCPQDDGNGGIVNKAPCKVADWVKGAPWVAFGASFGVAVGLTLILAPMAYYFALKALRNFDEKLEQEAGTQTMATAHAGSGSGFGEPIEGSNTIVIKSFTEDSAASFTDEKEQEKEQPSPKMCSKAWWKFKWDNAPWKQDLITEALREDVEAAHIHEDFEDFGERAEEFFKIPQVISATVQCIVHGSNDVANAAGPFASIYAIYKSGMIESNVETDYWILFLAGSAISVGLALYGYKVIKSVGVKITKVTPSRGFSIELGACLVILIASVTGIPISTTQVTVGSAVGVGIIDYVEGYEHSWFECGYFNFKRINWTLVGKIAVSWVVSFVSVAVICAAMSAFGMYGPSLQGIYEYSESWPVESV
eukprot:GHVO01017587.1.p1 GENE.GHVO01017587.1~~GHVO01017587.1.p1  ORF type:complete len:571 (+),score=50.07 GHVO01017587.1:3-1715(+)